MCVQVLAWGGDRGLASAEAKERESRGGALLGHGRATAHGHVARHATRLFNVMCKVVHTPCGLQACIFYRTRTWPHYEALPATSNPARSRSCALSGSPQRAPCSEAAASATAGASPNRLPREENDRAPSSRKHRVSTVVAAYGWWARSPRAPCRQSSEKAERERSPPARPLAGRARRFSSWRRAWTW